MKNMSDVKGKRVVIDATGVATLKYQIAALKGSGLDYKKDIKQVPTAGVAEAVNVFMEGKADVGWASLGMGKTKEAAAKVGGLYWLPVIKSADDPARKIVEEVAPGAVVKQYKAGSAPQLDHDTWLIELPINVVTHGDFSEEAAYVITKAIWENEKELAPIHPRLKGWRESMVADYAVIPYHPGAIRFYKEVNAWTEKMEQLQQKLLTE